MDYQVRTPLYSRISLSWWLGFDVRSHVTRHIHVSEKWPNNPCPRVSYCAQSPTMSGWCVVDSCEVEIDEGANTRSVGTYCDLTSETPAPKKNKSTLFSRVVKAGELAGKVAAAAAATGRVYVALQAIYVMSRFVS